MENGNNNAPAPAVPGVFVAGTAGMHPGLQNTQIPAQLQQLQIPAPTQIMVQHPVQPNGNGLPHPQLQHPGAMVQQQVQQQIQQQQQVQQQQQQAVPQQQQQQPQAQPQLQLVAQPQTQHPGGVPPPPAPQDNNAQRAFLEDEQRRMMFFNPAAMGMMQPQQFVLAGPGAPPGFVIPQMNPAQAMMNHPAQAAMMNPAQMMTNPQMQQMMTNPQMQQMMNPQMMAAGGTFFVPHMLGNPGAAMVAHQLGGGAGGASAGVAFAQMPTTMGIAGMPQQQQQQQPVIMQMGGDAIQKMGDNNNNKRGAGAIVEGQPIRPLSAYNFFFADEREKVLKEGQVQEDSKDTEKQTEVAKEAAVEEEETFDDKKTRLLGQHLTKDRTKRRPHRKTHGKIGFTGLSKIVGKRWRLLPDERKQAYRDIAAADLERYQKEVAEFNNDRLTKRQKN